jgi:hypothetical protein
MFPYVKKNKNNNNKSYIICLNECFYRLYNQVARQLDAYMCTSIFSITLKRIVETSDFFRFDVVFLGIL